MVSAEYTYAFEDTVLAAHCSYSAVLGLIRIAWRSVGRIVTCVVVDAERKQVRCPNQF